MCLPFFIPKKTDTMLEYISKNATEAAFKFLNERGYKCENNPESVRRALELMNAKEGVTGYKAIFENLHPDAKLFEEKAKETTKDLLAKPLVQFTGMDLLIVVLAFVVLNTLTSKLL